jgi:hypothetical protein
MEWTHGTPDLLAALAAALLLRRRLILAGWALHVALDTLSHEDGGATGKTQTWWLP